MKEALKEYFLVRRWFLHHVLLGLLVGLVAGAAVMWFVTDRYFDDSASANVIGVGGVSDTDGYFIQPVETEPKTVDIKKSSTVELVEPKTVELKRSTVKSSR